MRSCARRHMPCVTGLRSRRRPTAAQFPMLIRGLYFEDPTGKPVTGRHRKDFIGRIRREMERYDIDPERAARAVLQVVANRVTEERFKT